MVNEPTVNTLDPFNVILPKHIEERTYEKQLRGRLKRAGLNEIERNVVVFKFVYEMSLKDISEELGIPTLQTAHNILVRSLKQLREKGFGKR